MSTVIDVDDVWKKYRLGIIGTGTLRHDFERWWHRVRGKPDPHSKVDQRSEIRDRKSELAINVDHRISGVSASLGDDEVWALRGVSFGVKEGEILGIIGRNGAGKSTLLKILSRVTAPTRGEVRVKGRIASLLEVGTGFHPELTGRENIFLNGELLGMRRAEISAKFDEIVAFSGIEKFLDTPVKRYSSGMYVRLAFAVAAHLEPEILIVDEVLAVGDAEFQKKCLGKMQEVSRGGRTVLFVSHNTSAVGRLCDRAMLIHLGAIEAEGNPEEIIQRYLSSLVRAGAEWFRPESEQADGPIAINAVRTVSDHDEIQAVARFDSGLGVELQYTVHRPAKNTSILLRVTNSVGATIFTSWNTDASRANSDALSEGKYRSKCLIPPSLLRPGRYAVSVGVHEPGRKRWSYHEGVVSFEISSVGYPLNVSRAGVITPVLKWSTVTD
jgi:lipopolysaccharide transport system ATP-binding protein